jgi:hypothetical protein
VHAAHRFIPRKAVDAKYAEKNERRQRVTEKIRVTLKVNATFPAERSATFAISAIFAPLIAQQSCAPTKNQAVRVGAQLRWAMGVECQIPSERSATFAISGIFALKDLATAVFKFIRCGSGG